MSLKQLQTLANKRFSSREERLEHASLFFNKEVKSYSALNDIEQIELTHFLRTGNAIGAEAFAIFDKSNKQHKYILSLCLQLGWHNIANPLYADLARLGSFLKSDKSPIKKPLIMMNAKECSKLISALENIIKKKYK